MIDTMAIATDYAADTGDPEPYLRRIAEAGFRHIHWCHQWNTDFLYGPAELEQIGRLFTELHFSLNDLHGSDGREKAWGSLIEYQRQAGVELVKNRIDMAAGLSCDVVVMHAPAEPEEPKEREAYWTRFRRTLDELQPYCAGRGVRIAIENMANTRFFGTLGRLFELYPPTFLGLCYDSGHGNFVKKSNDPATADPLPPATGLADLEKVKDRLIALHLHDNDGTADQHKLLFMGTVDWSRLARIIAASGYAKPAITMEVGMKNSGIPDEREFLLQAAKVGEKFAKMVHKSRKGKLPNEPC